MINHNIFNNFVAKISVCAEEINPRENKSFKDSKDSKRDYKGFKDSKSDIKTEELSYKETHILEIHDKDVKITYKRPPTLAINKIKKSGTKTKEKAQDKQKKGGGLRGKIKEFTKHSAKRLKLFMNNAKAKWSNMITLTYPQNFITNGEEVKYHLNRFEKFLNSENAKYCWVIEFQENGSPHFHIILDKFINYKKVAENWYKIVNSGNENHLKAGTRTEKLRVGRAGAISYIRKYVSKQWQKKVPENYQNVGRFWGGSKGLLNPEIIEVSTELVNKIKNWYVQFLKQDNIPFKDRFGKPISIFEVKNLILWNSAEQVRQLIMEDFS